MSRHRLHGLWALVPSAVALGGVVAAGCGADNALVGGACAYPLTQCGFECVDLETDPENCGSCGLTCATGVCEMGQCAAALGDASTGGGDGAPGDGAADGTLPGDSTTPEDGSLDGSDTGGAAGDGPVTDGSRGDATPADGQASDGSAPDGAADGAAADSTPSCVTPFDTPAQCGDCTTSCADAAPFCAPSGSTFTCVASCAPLQDCDGTCVDTTSDALNCGGCGIVCPSQICTASKCVGSTAGSVVFIGHDYATTMPGTAQARVLANAVLLAPTDPVSVLSYERYADATTLSRIDAIVGGAGAGLGRTVDITSTNTDSDIPGTLEIQTYGVLLVADQVNALGDVDLGALGASWAATLATFTQSGGIVVILDGGTGAGQMPAFASGTGLLDVTAQTTLATGTALYVLAPSDSLSVGVVNPYAAGENSVTVTTEPNTGSVDYVIAPAIEAGTAISPTVVHKVF
ncbi:MAG TPA: hypothetical protein VEK07_24755 [Polyangiaceae bacterium]|nr:hypothetical protein [Polyangiaceae bacterium]